MFNSYFAKLKQNKINERCKTNILCTRDKLFTCLACVVVPWPLVHDDAYESHQSDHYGKGYRGWHRDVHV